MYLSVSHDQKAEPCGLWKARSCVLAGTRISPTRGGGFGGHTRQTSPQSIFSISTWFARGQQRCGLWLPVYCSNLSVVVASTGIRRCRSSRRSKSWLHSLRFFTPFIMCTRTTWSLPTSAQTGTDNRSSHDRLLSAWQGRQVTVRAIDCLESVSKQAKHLWSAISHVSESKAMEFAASGFWKLIGRYCRNPRNELKCVRYQSSQSSPIVHTYTYVSWTFRRHAKSPTGHEMSTRQQRWIRQTFTVNNSAMASWLHYRRLGLSATWPVHVKLIR